MTILKLNKLNKTNSPKSYKVLEGVLYIDEVEVSLPTDTETAEYDVSSCEDVEAITRESADSDLVVSLNLYVNEETYMDFFSMVKKGDLISDATFPYQIVDGKVVWYNNIEAFEGMEW